MGHSDLANAFERAKLDGSAIDAAHLDFGRSREVWNGLIDRRPGVIVRAGSSDDIAKTIEIAATTRSALAVRCGGHSYPGFSTCDDGIVLDLSRLNTVSADPRSGLADVQGGALLSDVDSATLPHDAVVPAGVVSHTGVGGLTLGGGMGWMSRRHGLSIDNLLEVDLVTAGGKRLRVNAESEPELFWGLRGGGGNFGVVLSFKFRMRPLGPVLVGHWTYRPADAPAALRRYRELAAAAGRQLTTAFALTASALNMTAMWSGSSEGAEAAVAPFGRLAEPLTASLGPMPFLALQSRSDEDMRWGRRFYAKGGFLAEMSDAAIERIAAALAASPAPDSNIYVLQLGGAVGDVGDGATAYTGRAANFYWIAAPVWDDPALDQSCLAWGRTAAQSMAAISLAGNYVNEQADTGRETTLQAYGAAKLRRLAALKRRYDPANLFRLNQNIEPGE